KLRLKNKGREDTTHVEKYIEKLAMHRRDSEFIIGSVNKFLTGNFVRTINPVINKNCKVIGPNIKKKYYKYFSHNSNLGLDRLADMIACRDIYNGQDFIVIDAGTAVTMDCVNRSGRYLGGVIFPGLEILIMSIKAGIPALPSINISKRTPFPALSTVGCLNSGIVLGLTGQIEYFVNLIKNKFRRNFKVIACGGSIEMIKKKTRIIDKYDAYLTLKGYYNINKEVPI
ncbi:MAG: type III pantothenate kinase, partial [bacterium]